MKFLEAIEGWVFLDPATRTGIASVHAGELHLSTIYVPKADDRPTALYLYFHTLIDELEKRSPAVVCVEGYAIQGRGNAVQAQVELGACCRLAGVTALADVVILNIATWKSLTFAGKKGSKGEQVDYVYKAAQFLEQTPRNSDEADAGLMAYAAALILGDHARWSKGIQSFRDQVASVVAGGRVREDGLFEGGARAKT